LILILLFLDSVIPSGGHLTSISFESLSERGVSDLTLKAIAEMKLTTMTEIQAKSIGPLLEGR
jgi:superfamily II DNA/RNA helicase